MNNERSGSRVTGDSSGLRADAHYRYDFLPDKRRLHARYIGAWNEEIAQEALTAFHRALGRAGSGGQPFTLLDDFRDWQVQSPQVTAIAFGFEVACRDFPISRNAMVIPNPQVRMLVRRTLTDFNLSKIFESYDLADRWLVEVESP